MLSHQGGSPVTQEDTPHEEESEESIEAVENLLESYFMQVDSLYDRLVSMGELPDGVLSPLGLIPSSPNIAYLFRQAPDRF